MAKYTKRDAGYTQRALDAIDLNGGTSFPRGLLFGSRPDLGIFTFGGQHLIWKLRHADEWMQHQVRLTHHKVGRKLVVTAHHFLGDNVNSGAVSRNIAYEVTEVKQGGMVDIGGRRVQHFAPAGKNYRMYFGLTRAYATQGGSGVGSKPFDIASHGVYLERGTGIFGVHKRRTAKMRNDGMRARPFLTPSLEKNQMWIDQQYNTLGNELGAYLGRTGPVGRRG